MGTVLHCAACCIVSPHQFHKRLKHHKTAFTHKPVPSHHAPHPQAALRSGNNGIGSSPQAMALLSDVAAGLAALHERAIVHRDLKPHNCLITDSCRAKLSDMGLSKQLVAEQSSFESHGAGGCSGGDVVVGVGGVAVFRVGVEASSGVGS